MAGRAVGPHAVSPRSDTTTLEQWLAAHGPLGPSSALLVALDVCARASRLSRAGLAEVIGSLNAAGIGRREHGGWSWTPIRQESAASFATDTDIIQRVGALMFHSLTGQALTFASQERALRTMLRGLRPDLPAGVADLIVRAVSARDGDGFTLAGLTRDVRRELGVEHGDGRRRSWRVIATLGAAAAVLLLGVSGWVASNAGDWIGAHGLTARETAMVDVLLESSQTFAIIEEHTAAIQQYQDMEQVWRRRLQPGDPRLAWNQAREAWVRTLAGDGLTTEQLLEGKPPWLGAQLGDGHPYTRTARLLLASTLEARGAAADAHALRAEAERATRDLLDGTACAANLSPEIPVPPGVLAHVAPNAPEREGFRQGRDGSYFAPLTSVQRWIAARDGWRLHVVARGPCVVSVAAGATPGIVTVRAAPAAGRAWQVRVEGATPPRTLHAAADRVGISLVADGAGAMQAIVGDERADLSLDAAGPVPAPPYTLAFAGGAEGAACAVVWLEIPFPSRAGASPSSIPSSSSSSSSSASP